METITAKRLHSQTKAILDWIENGTTVIVTRHGRAIAKLEPISKSNVTDWSDVMNEVWKAQEKLKSTKRLPNGVLAERQRKRR
jgi:antitoxin (DNA-binding transcriptional repressor) of toxin-antitoxin stability system